MAMNLSLVLNMTRCKKTFNLQNREFKKIRDKLIKFKKCQIYAIYLYLYQCCHSLEKPIKSDELHIIESNRSRNLSELIF